MHKREFFQHVQDLAEIIKPIKDSIILLENQDSNIANCFFSLAQLEVGIKKISESVHKMFHWHCIKISISASKNLILTNICLHITYISSEYKGKCFKTLILFYSIFLYLYLLIKVIIGIRIV